MRLLLVVATLFLLAGALCLTAGAGAVRHRRPLGAAAGGLSGLAALALAGLLGTLAVAVHGYRALAHEEVAAVIRTEPTGPAAFRATFRFPDGTERAFELHGDALYVDAHVVKWHPWANLVGLHTAYELDRVAGRYRGLREEQTRPRTVYALGRERVVALPALVRALPALTPLVDAEYGSATFADADRPAELELRVSTSGLLFRRR